MSQSIVLLATISLVITDLEKSTAEPQKYVMCGMDPCDKGERFCDKIDMICSPCKYLESYCRTNDKDVGCLMYNCISTVMKNQSTDLEKVKSEYQLFKLESEKKLKQDKLTIISLGVLVGVLVLILLVLILQPRLKKCPNIYDFLANYKVKTDKVVRQDETKVVDLEMPPEVQPEQEAISLHPESKTPLLPEPVQDNCPNDPEYSVCQVNTQSKQTDPHKFPPSNISPTEGNLMRKTQIVCN